MLSSASILLTIASIAWASQRRRLPALGAGLVASLACVRSWGWVEGLLIELTIAMVAACALVLWLAPRARWTARIAFTSAVFGLTACALGFAT